VKNSTLTVKNMPVPVASTRDTNAYLRNGPVGGSTARARAATAAKPGIRVTVSAAHAEGHSLARLSKTQI
jgi:hypothetical protein